MNQPILGGIGDIGARSYLIQLQLAHVNKLRQSNFVPLHLLEFRGAQFQSHRTLVYVPVNFVGKYSTHDECTKLVASMRSFRPVHFGQSQRRLFITMQCQDRRTYLHVIGDVFRHRLIFPQHGRVTPRFLAEILQSQLDRLLRRRAPPPGGGIAATFRAS